MLLMHAAQKRRVPSLGAGQIFAVMGLKETRTGDTLTAPGHALVLERISDYEPVISQAIEAASMRDRELLLEALARIADEDPSFQSGEDADTGQLLISGMGELHLEVVAERLRREFKVDVRTGEPRVLMRETLTATAEAEAVFERKLDGDEIFGQASVRVGPLPRGAGFRFSIAPEAAALPFLREEVRHQIADGAREAADSGVLQGFPLQDVEVVLTGAAWREGASKPFAYKVATADAVRAAAARASPVLLEPIMKLELAPPERTPRRRHRRRGRAQGDHPRRRRERGAAVKVIQAEAPLRRMFGFATELRSLTQGRAIFTMEFDRYDAA